MYQWVSDEAWLILGIISLIIYLFKGIDYNKNILDEKNEIICWVTGISVFQIILSVIKIYGILIEFEKIISNMFHVYGFLFVLRVLATKKMFNSLDKILIFIFLLSVTGIVIIKFTD
ncbi:hypothetical protein [Phascolarctobacterium sp.]|uniref:hypothetical protein n=1 Tax=Phascolarctobacterium sp. TaxID=2049039 RepID=UPI003F807F42